MARQSTTPVPFQRTTRADNGSLYSSGRAGKSIMAGAIPVLRGDSASGNARFGIILSEMPKALRNAVAANIQAWFVPKTTDPRFASHEEFISSYQGEPIKRFGQADSPPLAFYRGMTTSHRAEYEASDFVKTLGLHYPIAASGAGNPNTELLDSYNTVWNFRAAAHSSHIPLREYYSTTLAAGHPVFKFARAFWPQNRFSSVVADYEAALVQGQLSLDVQAGRIPVSGIGVIPFGAPNLKASVTDTYASGASWTHAWRNQDGGGAAGEGNIVIKAYGTTETTRAAVFAEMAGQSVLTSLADLDKARTTQAFAKLRTSYAGNDTTGYSNDDAIVAELMQGFTLPEDVFKRPWLLDAKALDFGMVERHATDAANLDKSVTRGMIQASLSINLPKQDVGGFIIFIIEVVPHRIYERQGDPSLLFATANPTGHLPDALRDVQRTLPVDNVQNWRIDAKHSTAGGLYGYEPMNDKWRRSYTRLGGHFYQATPGSGQFDEARSALWIPEIVNPLFTVDHYLVPENFPHDVFADTAADAFEFQVDHSLSINGLTQFGDVLFEDNDEWAQTESAS